MHNVGAVEGRRRRTQTVKAYSPTSTPNSTACRSALQRVSEFQRTCMLPIGRQMLHDILRLIAQLRAPRAPAWEGP